MTDSGGSSLCPPIRRCSEHLSDCIEICVPMTALPPPRDKASSWGAPNPDHLHTAGDPIFSQLLACVFQLRLCARIPLGLQMYRSPALPPCFLSKNQDSGSTWWRDEKQGLEQSQFSGTSAHYPISPTLPFIPWPSFDWSRGNFSNW